MNKTKQTTLTGEHKAEDLKSSNRKRIKRELKEYEVDMGERGIYNKKNKLNELTGKEWTYFINSIQITDFAKDEKEYELWKFLQNSIIETKYSTNGDESFGHNLRKVHPSPKPPQLMRDLIAFFTKSNSWILDPFMGVGGTLLGASLLPERNAVGIEIEKNYIRIYEDVCKQEKLKKQISICDDSRNIMAIKEIENIKFDLILTDPPYANMLSRKRTGGDRKDKGSFTSDDRDLGNISYESFFVELKDIIEKSVSLLKNKGYLVIFCKDMQPTDKKHNLVHAEIVEELIKIPNIFFKGYKIWYDKTINLYPYGYPFSYVSNQLHQFILIFRKEEKDKG